MPANWSDFTVCAHQKLDVAHVLGEAHVLKDEHVLNQPVLLEEIAIRIAAISQSWLLSHGGKEKLRWKRTQSTRKLTGPSHHHSHLLTLYTSPWQFFLEWKRNEEPYCWVIDQDARSLLCHLSVMPGLLRGFIAVLTVVCKALPVPNLPLGHSAAATLAFSPSQTGWVRSDLGKADSMIFSSNAASSGGLLWPNNLS